MWPTLIFIIILSILFVYINSSFIGNIAPDNVILGALFIPMILSGGNIFNNNLGTSIEVIMLFVCIILKLLEYFWFLFVLMNHIAFWRSC